MWVRRPSWRKGPNAVIPLRSPEQTPLGRERWGLSLTQALPPDLQGILCGKQGLGEADEDLGPERAAVISPCLPPPWPPNTGYR